MKTLSTLVLALFTSISTLAQFPETDVFVQGQLGISNITNRTLSWFHTYNNASYGVNVGVDVHLSDHFSLRTSAGYHAFGEAHDTRVLRDVQGSEYELNSQYHTLTTNLNLGGRFWLGELPIALGLGGNLHSFYQGISIWDVTAVYGQADPGIVGRSTNYKPQDEKRIGFGPYAEALYRFKITDQIGLNTGLFYTYTIFPKGEDHGGFDLWSLNASVELSYSF